MTTTVTGIVTLTAVAMAVLGMVSCGGRGDRSDDIPRATIKVDPATAGTISGTVTFDGAPPPRTEPSTESDPACASANPELLPDEVTQAVVVRDGKLANVFVYISEGLKGSTPPPEKPAVIDQQGCRYHPHILGVVAGQKVEFRNSDATLHNVHSEATINRPFNIAQAVQGKIDTKVFNEPEQMIPIVCDVHGWMKCYIGVLPHGFFAITAADGRYTLPPLPPGSYTVTAWHERYGTRTATVTVGPKESKEVSFSFIEKAPGNL